MIRSNFKAERDTLIDDIMVLRTNLKRYEYELSKYKNAVEDIERYINKRLEIAPANKHNIHIKYLIEKNLNPEFY
ncbi:hypothetical protein K0017_05145 [Staphylococcus massiliensis]|uniref:hypothetical protein n=1 Tax=Staphylococcus massiliensis TaxID=555791 RepID=UPI001EDFFB80|nr:hypothetical protein [Staphylococcus massiliensis]MCG3401705.1 hypothetical protein [Staphylococcus massiliensis]